MSEFMQKEFPTESYLHGPEQPFQATDILFQFVQLSTFYDVPGEYGHFLEGHLYGFDALTIIITETYPSGGPALHSHECEEAHVLVEGTVSYVIGDQRFVATAPYIVKIPAGVPHTFLNIGTQPIRIVGILPEDHYTEKEFGPNSLIES
jgi:mannose-6-phosphate isomerase-like protein (cupin superfamily)